MSDIDLGSIDRTGDANEMRRKLDDLLLLLIGNVGLDKVRQLIADGYCRISEHEFERWLYQQAIRHHKPLFK